MIGSTVDGKYRIDAFIGKGGMGSVFKATHLGTDRVVALKMIDRRFTGNADLLERFKREARAAGRLRHPHVVDVTDFGIALDETGQTAYMVMELLEGCTLAEVLEEVPRPPLPWVVEIFDQVCSAVHVAHENGILHRDIKPSNIWLEPDLMGGLRAKVLDFGLARFDQPEPPGGTVQRATPEPPATDDSRLPTVVVPPLTGKLLAREGPPTLAGATTGERTDPATDLQANPLTPSWQELTHTGSVLGTPHYMAPEQCRGERVDAKADIYSLGVVLFQMLVGELPFVADERGDVMSKQIRQPPPVARRINRAVPRAVSDLVTSALAKDPANRPLNAEVFATQLRGRAETIGPVIKRAVILAVTHLPVFLRLFALVYIPVLAVQALLRLVVIDYSDTFSARGLSILSLSYFGIQVAESFAAITLRGLTTLVLAQVLLMRYRPPKLRTAFDLLRLRRLDYPKALVTYLGVNVLPFRGATNLLLLAVVLVSGATNLTGRFSPLNGHEVPLAALCVVLVPPLLWIFTRYCLYPIVFFVEDKTGLDGGKRARELARSGRSVVTWMVAIDFTLWTIETILDRFVFVALVGTGYAGDLARVGFFLVFQSLVAPLLAISYAMLYINLRLGSGETVHTILRPFGSPEPNEEKLSRVDSVLGEIRSLSKW